MTVEHRGFSAWITSNGQVLPEYEVAIDNKLQKVTSWVPSYEGIPFTIHWKDHGGQVDTAAYIILDGFVVAGRFLFGEGEACRDGVRTGNNTERPFVFAKADETEEAAAGGTSQRGMIVLKIKRVQRLADKTANQVQQVPDIPHGPRRPGDHCVGFGQEKETWLQHPTTWSVIPYDQNDPGSYVTFVFRYRSPDFLLAEGIISSISEIPQLERPSLERHSTSGVITPRITPTPSPKPALIGSGGIEKALGDKGKRKASNSSPRSSRKTSQNLQPPQMGFFSSHVPDIVPMPTTPNWMDKMEKMEDEDMNDD